jgi:hypothetical protein
MKSYSKGINTRDFLDRITPVVNIVPMDWPVRDVFIYRVATNLRED